jgi:hypothetical protein
MEFLSGQREHALAKAATGTMEADLRGTHGDTELFGNGVVGEIVDIAQDDDRTEAGRQVADRVVELTPERIDIGLGGRVGLGTHIGHVSLVGQLVVVVTAPLARGRRRAVRNDAIEPCRELGVAAEPIEAAIGTEVSVLHDISRIFLVAGESQGQPIRISIRTAHHLVERFTFARNGPLDEFVHFGVWKVRPAGAATVT